MDERSAKKVAKQKSDKRDLAIQKALRDRLRNSQVAYTSYSGAATQQRPDFLMGSKRLSQM